MRNELFLKYSTCDIADYLERQNIMDCSVASLWDRSPRLEGPAFVVRCEHGDSLMLHAAIYQAPKGSIIVASSSDLKSAVAGGNVCAVAKKRGIKGFIIDGAVRDIDEIRQLKFPVFARAVVPRAATRDRVSVIRKSIYCAGVKVFTGDTIVADLSGIVVIPKKKVLVLLTKLHERALFARNQSLIMWESNHRSRISKLLKVSL